MSDAFYTLVRFVGRHVFWLSSRPTVLHIDRICRPGAFILASNHLSPFDVPLLIHHSSRKLDFVSITEVFRKPLLGWFYGSMNAFPLDRWKPDAPTVRIILDRLARGRVVAMFPEGHVRKVEDSVVHGGKIRPGVARLAQMANVPIIPVVLINSRAYGRPINWAPLRRVRYGANFGKPIEPSADLDKQSAAEDVETRLRAAYVDLYQELSAAMRKSP